MDLGTHMEESGTTEGKKRKIISTHPQILKEKQSAEYRVLAKEVKKGAKTDRKAYIDRLAEEAKTSKQDMHTLYRLTKTLARKTQITIKDHQGNLLSKEDDILKCWKTHFERVFNTDDPESEAVITPAEDILGIITAPPSVDKVKKAISAPKKVKAAGIDQINAELLKAEEEHITPIILTDILQKIWTTEEIPFFWSTGLIVKLPN